MPDYNSDAGLLAHLTAQKQNIVQFQTEADASAADVVAITEDCDNVAWIIDFATLVEEYKGTAFAVKKAFFTRRAGRRAW